MIYSTDASFIRLAGCIPNSSVDGPGIRYVIFFQGCFHGCVGCHNPTTHDWESKDSEDVPIDVLIKHFKENAVCNRVTISGGEPFGQPQALLALLLQLHEVGVNDIWIYTGYTYEELQEVEIFREILKHCNTVVTGPFVMAQKAEAPLFAGSSNQQIITINPSM